MRPFLMGFKHCEYLRFFISVCSKLPKLDTLDIQIIPYQCISSLKCWKIFPLGFFYSFSTTTNETKRTSKKRAFFSPIFLCHFYYFQHGLSAAALLIFKYYVIHSWFAPQFFWSPLIISPAAPSQFLLKCANPVSKLPKV